MNHVQGKTERYLSGIYYSLWGNAVSIIGGLMTIAVASRYLIKEDLGVYYIVLMITSLSVAFASFGGRSTIIRFLAGAKAEEKYKTANLLITLRIASLIPVFVCLSFFLLFIDQVWPGKSLESVKWMILLIVVMEFVADSGLSMLAGYKLFKQFAFFHGLKGGLTCVVSILMLISGFGLKGLLMGVLSVSFGVNIALICALPVRYELFWSQKLFLEILKFSAALYIAFLISLLSARTAEAIIVSFMGAASLAIYGNAMRFPNLLLRMFEAIRPVILYYFSSGKELNNSLAPLKYTSIAVSIVASLLIVFAEPIIWLVFSEAYLASVPLIRLLSFWMVLSLVNYILVIQLTGSDRTTKVIWTNTVQFVVVVSGHFLLIPKFGAMGAATSMIVGAFITVMVSTFFLSMNNTSVFAKSIAISFRPVLPLFFLLLTIQISGSEIILSTVYWLLFISILFLTKTLTIDEIKGLINVLKASAKPV